MAGSRISAALCVLAMFAATSARTAPPSTGRVLRVTSSADDTSPGTLRSAIELSNATPDRDTISIEVPRITVRAPLPTIKGPVSIEGSEWRRTGEYATIDGSDYVQGNTPESCPGATPGQFGANVRTMTAPGLQLIDTGDVDIAGIDVHHFCIGILLNRATRVDIHDNRITNNLGGAGVMITGDDGQGNPTSTTTNNNKVLRNEFVDNGDGLELTRGAAFNVIADNLFRSTPANPEPSQGIEILRGNDNVVSGNRFEGYSDGLQINWGDRNYISANTFTNNTFGLNLTGVGNIVDNNVITGNRVGIVVRPADPSPTVRLTRNRITANGVDIRRCEAGGSCDAAAPKAAMAFGLPGLEHENFVGSRGGGVAVNPSTIQYICPQHPPACQAAPNRALAAPMFTAARGRGLDVEFVMSITASPNTYGTVELFGNTSARGREAEVFLRDAPVSTGVSGTATISVRVPRSQLTRIQSVTATVTVEDGATSPLSAAMSVKQFSSAQE